MDSIDRRKFIKRAGVGAAGMAMAGPWVTSGLSQKSPNETIRVAVMGIRGRGGAHAENFAKMKNVEVVTICDIDERLFPKAVDEVAAIQGKKPKTEVDIRKVCEDKNVDVLSVASTNQWHALATIWAIQGGKDVYVEKPVSYSIWEGRKMIEAARKYKKIVQVGSQNRSRPVVQGAMDFMHKGGIGDVYMVRVPFVRPRESFGRGKVTAVPEGVHFNLWLGPAPERPFIDNRFHYNWHWFWDMGNGEVGNNGPHYMDMARWALQEYEHPVKAVSTGGYYQWDCDQETPNVQSSTLQYASGKIVQFDVQGLYDDNDRSGIFFIGTEGYLKLEGSEWKTYYGRKREPGESMTDEQAKTQYDTMNTRGTGGGMHFENFIAAVRSRKRKDLNADIQEGHMAASMCHLCNMAYRVDREIHFDSKTETVIGDPEAQKLVRRNYRAPFVIPDQV